MMIKLLQALALIVSAAFLTGCASGVGAKNTLYIEGRVAPSLAASIVYICRPSTTIPVGSSAGLYLETEPTLDLGHGERYTINTIQKEEIVLGFVTKLGSSNNSVSLTLKNASKNSYVIFETKNESSTAGIVLTALFGGPINISMKARSVSKAQYDAECNAKESRQLTHKSLLLK